MSIKKTTIFYPHIVKEYESVEQFLSENSYGEYYNEVTAGLVSVGIDMNDETQYKESLSDDLFEVIATIVFPNEAAWEAYLAGKENENRSLRAPIFEEESEDHIL